MHELHKKFEKLIGKDDLYNIFNDFLDFTIAFHEMDKTISIPVLEKLDKKYADDAGLLFDIYLKYVERMNYYLNDDGKKYYDLLGNYYEEFVTSSNKSSTKGQFFTPENVTEVMSSLLGLENLDGIIYDCAGGSGRTLLNSHVKNPKNLCISWDLDLQACKMCVINFIFNGVRGAVVNINSLSMEFYSAWKIHECISLCGVQKDCVMMVNNLDAAHCFIGESTKRNSENSCEKDKQTTLMRF